MNLSLLLRELKRRKVFRVAGVYAAVAFVIWQAADIAFPALHLPDWLVTAVVALTLLGFPLALVLAWVFDITSAGVVRTDEQGAVVERVLVSRATQRTQRTRRMQHVAAAGGVLVLALAGGAFIALGSRQSDLAPQPERSIAVLPFADFSPGADQQWFSDGLTDEILNALARLPDVRVASRTGSFRFRGSSEDVRTIAASLGVAHILEGSVRRDGDRLRITVQLIRASDDARLWSHSFDRLAADVIAVQEEIAYEIARTMRTALEPDALRRMVFAGTTSVAAYEAFLHGQHLWRTAARENLQGQAELEALAAFELAAQLDPQFAAAHLAAAEFWLVQLLPNRSSYGLTDLPYRERYSRAEQRLRAAAAAATDEVRRLRAEARLAHLQLRLREGFSLLQRAAELQPLDAQIWQDLGEQAVRIGEHAAARTALLQAAALVGPDAETLTALGVYLNRVDPAAAAELTDRAYSLDSLSASVLYQGHRILLTNGRVADAARYAQQYMARLDAGRWGDMVVLRQACAEGRTQDALATFERMDDDATGQWLGLLYLGRPDEAAAVLRVLDDEDGLFALAGHLEYSIFDARPYPRLSAVLARQGVVRPEPAYIPYACAAEGSASDRKAHRQ